MSNYSEVDSYVVEKLVGDDPELSAALENNRKNELPAIDVSVAQGKLLHLFARAAGAKRALEIGTLGGYSTIWIARALPEGGKVTTLEYSPKHAKVAKENITRAGLDSKVDIKVGAALDTLQELYATNPDKFDFVFIDADKPNSLNYVNWALKLSHVGTVIIVDNVIRRGAIINEETDDDIIVSTRNLFDALGKDKRLSSVAIQTVGQKGHDGFIYAFVEKPE